jgi:hypothetical protein
MIGPANCAGSAHVSLGAPGPAVERFDQPVNMTELGDKDLGDHRCLSAAWFAAVAAGRRRRANSL